VQIALSDAGHHLAALLANSEGPELRHNLQWAHHRTTQNNWRIFNILMLSFLKKNGYPIDDELLKSHLLWVASYHAGKRLVLDRATILLHDQPVLSSTARSGTAPLATKH